MQYDEKKSKKNFFKKVRGMEQDENVERYSETKP